MSRNADVVRLQRRRGVRQEDDWEENYIAITFDDGTELRWSVETLTADGNMSMTGNWKWVDEDDDVYNLVVHGHKTTKPANAAHEIEIDIVGHDWKTVNGKRVLIDSYEIRYTPAGETDAYVFEGTRTVGYGVQWAGRDALNMIQAEGEFPKEQFWQKDSSDMKRIKVQFEVFDVPQL